MTRLIVENGSPESFAINDNATNTPGRKKTLASNPAIKAEGRLRPEPLMLDGERQNINISAYRVLYILLLLVKKKSLSLVELNQYLYDNPLIERTYNNETITKYINTLRRVGCTIPKSTSKNDYRYCLTEYPFPLRLEPEAINTLYYLLDMLAKSIDETLQRRSLLFLQHVAWMLAEDQKQALLERIVMFEPRLSNSAKKRLIQTYQGYCKDALALEVECQGENHLPEIYIEGKKIIEPLRVIQQGQGAFLLAKDRMRNKSLRIRLDKILAVRQLPDKVNMAQRQNVVVFQLYGRLARTYRPYPGEEIVFAKGDMLQVRCLSDNIDALLNRLLKYNTLCQVISPLAVREQMRDRILRLLQIAQGGHPSNVG